ncbi:uncharacterized protein LOC134265333 [Saccostrea cucullata]|uniref:uncharacterized protein LOC134265333 n=1 Tax=Saccostrea cuccullata TaxID=36930 RepID=UPI002ED6BF56
MLNVIRSPLHSSKLSFQYEEVDHFPKRSQNKEDRLCSCFYQKNLKVAKEKERIKQFSIWFAEVDKYKQEEYIKRRRKWRLERQYRARKFWKIRCLLIPVMLFLCAGSFLLLACHLPFLELGDWFKEKKSEWTVIGSVCVGIAFVLFMFEQGLLSHYGNKTQLKRFAQFDQVKTNKSVLPNSTYGKSTDEVLPKSIPNLSPTFAKEENQINSASNFDSIDSEETIETLNEDDPLLTKLKKRSPTMSEIAQTKKAIQRLRSVDTAVSALTEVTFLSSNDSS